MAIDCNKCSVTKFCGTMIATTRLCPSVHPEWWNKKEKTTTTTQEEEQYYEDMNALYG